MPKGMLYDRGKKKWRTVEDIMENDINKPLDELINTPFDWEGRGFEKPSAKTVENARSILGDLVDQISAHNESEDN